MPKGKSDYGQVFVSYSHQDAEWLDKIRPHLRGLEKHWDLTVWEDTKIQPGNNWYTEIQEALHSARAAVLLVSASFLASDFIIDEELPVILNAASEKKIVVLPIILSHCAYDQIDKLCNIQSINPSNKPLAKLSEGEQAEYFDLLRREILKAINFGEPAMTKRDSPKNSRIINFHYRQNPYFTGRNTILSQLHEGFQSGDTAQALFGLGGVGKTQAAVQYVYEFQNDYRNIFWANAQTEDSLILGFTKIAQTLGLPEGASKDQLEAVEAVKRWIERKDQWLLVLDHIEDQNLIRSYLPRYYSGCMLLTARRQLDSEDVTSQQVKAMSTEEGALFILRSLRELKVHEPLTAAPFDLREQAEHLSALLGGLPQALAQAAAYIKKNHLELEEYIETYNIEREQFLRGNGAAVSDDEMKNPSIAVTFQMSFQKLTLENPTSANILRISAFLDGDEIPEEIFLQYPDVLGEEFLKLPEPKKNVEFHRAIGAGNRYSLLTRDKKKRHNSINRLVQEVITMQMSDAERRFWAEQAVRVVGRAFLPPDPQNWKSDDRIIRHAMTLAGVIDEKNCSLPDAARLLERSGAYMLVRGRYNQAERLFMQFLRLFQNGRESEGEEMVSVLHKLSILHRSRGRLDIAEDYLLRSMEVHEKSPAPEESQKAQLMNSRAQLLTMMARLDEAELLYQKARRIWEVLKGPDSLEIGYLMNNLGDVYHRQTKPEQAEIAYLTSLKLLEKHLDANNPQIANVLCNLAKCYRALGRYDEAENLYLRSITIHKIAHGNDEHPYLAIILGNLALLYQSQEKYIHAEQAYHQALLINEKAGITESLGYAILLENMGSLYQQLDILDKAESYYKRSIDIVAKVLDSSHPDLIRIRNGYYSVLADLRK